jgi:hypothetical protein
VKDSPPIQCFRGSTHLKHLGESLKGYHDKLKKSRIRCRKLESDSPFLRELLRGEKKIERVLRSKNPLDGFFELVPLAPWRQTTALRTTCTDGEEIIQLDFKNFYPSILCSSKFPHPAELTYYNNINESWLKNFHGAGIVRVRLILKPSEKNNDSTWVDNLHPFQIQNDSTSLPFLIERGYNGWGRPIETLIHINEISIWERFFEIEPIEAIATESIIDHPLKNRCIRALEELETLRSREGNEEKIDQLKIQINAASSTPKIGTNKLENSPYGVHCLPSQIISNGKALLFQTISVCIENDPSISILQINTDGFLVKTKNRKALIETLHNASIFGDEPGKLRIKSIGNETLTLGANVWWLNKEDSIIESCGFPKPSKRDVPLSYQYEYNGKKERIHLIHLADFKHTLNFETLERKKIILPQEILPTTPWEYTFKEKNRSFQKTLHELRKYSKRFIKNLI